MTPEDKKVLSHLAAVPYLLGGSSMAGLDCWGLIEQSYEKCPTMRVVLPNRGNIAPGSIGLYRGWRKQDNFRVLPEDENLQDFDVLMMYVMKNGRRYVGHCGLVCERNIFHTEEKVGAILEPIKGRPIQTRKAFGIRHVSRCGT